MAEGSVFARVHVLVICDEIEERLGQEHLFDLVGVRTQILAQSFPYVHPQLCIFLQVTGHEGMVSGHVVVVNEANEQEVIDVPIEELQLSGPLQIISFWTRIQNCKFRDPGVHWFQVFLAEKLVAERRFHVSATTGGTNGRPTH